MNARVLESEWLDTLPPSDPRARRSRRDLVRVNALMGNAGIIRRELQSLGAIRSLAEIGAGDGRFALSVVRGLAEPPERITLVDRQAILDPDALAAFEASLVIAEADVFDWLDTTTGAFDVIVANLFLHHFDDAALTRLFALAAPRTRAFIACEPRRGLVASAGARLLGLVGCNDVTRHDAIVSTRAGFSGHELTRLWPTGWLCDERSRGLFSHGFIALKP
jgi:hypothetical protein